MIQERFTILAGKKYPYRLIQRPGTRSVRMKISMSKGLEVTVPKRYRAEHVDEVLAEHQDWILKQFHKMEAKKNRPLPQFENGSILTVLGEAHTIKIYGKLNGKSTVKRIQKLNFEEDHAEIGGHEFHIHCDGTIPDAKEELEKYLRGIAEKYFHKQAAEFAKHMGVTFGNITIRGQKTRWGSCTLAKNLSFNWRLILLPPQVTNSVIIHELAHTIHMNHSRAFYEIVENFCPEYRKLQKYLKDPQFPL